MQIKGTPLMKLHYDPGTDVLRVEWPELDNIRPEVVDSSLAHIKDAVSSYFIKRFLLDARKTSHLPDTVRLREQMIKFFTALSGTPLQKVARLESENPDRAARTAIIKDLITSDTFCITQINFQFRDFETEEEAMSWLLEE